MSYLEKSLTSGEEIKLTINYHWFAYVPVVGFFCVGLICLPIGGFIFLSLTGFFFLVTLLSYLNIRFTEQGLTTKKSIVKKGVISVKTEELLITKTETVEMNQSVFGRIFGYGNVKLTGTGSSSLTFETVVDPLDVKKSIEELVSSNN